MSLGLLITWPLPLWTDPCSSLWTEAFCRDLSSGYLKHRYSYQVGLGIYCVLTVWYKGQKVLRSAERRGKSVVWKSLHWKRHMGKVQRSCGKMHCSCSKMGWKYSKLPKTCYEQLNKRFCSSLRFELGYCHSNIVRLVKLCIRTLTWFFQGRTFFNGYTLLLFQYCFYCF